MTAAMSALARRPPALTAMLREAMVQAMAPDDADLRVAGNVLEEASEAITSSGSMAMAAGQVTSLAARQPDASPLAAILIDLRNRWLEQAISDWTAQLAATHATQPDLARAAWRAALADAVGEFRFDLASRIAAAWVWPQSDDRASPKLLVHWADCADSGRWRESRPLFQTLAEDVTLDARLRARVFAILGEIEAVVLGDFAAARTACASAERLDATDWRRAFTEGRLAAEEQPKSDEAERIFQTAADSWPDIGHIRAEWALLRARRDDLDGAQDVMARAGACRFGAMQLIDAQLDLCAYHQLFPTEQRRIEPLVARARLLADVPRNAADTMVRAGRAFEANGKTPEAARWYQRALEVAPDFIGPRVALGYLFLAEKRLAEAEAEFKRVVEISPEAEGGQWGLANLAAEAHDWTGLIAAARRTLAVAPDWRRSVTDLLRNTAENMLDESRDVAVARVFYDGVRDILGPDYEGRYRNLLGHLAYWESDYAAAAAEYRKAIAAAGDKPDARFHGNLTLALENLYNAGVAGDDALAEAIAHARRAMEIDPATTDYPTYLQRLELIQAYIARHGKAATKLLPDQYRVRLQLDSRLVPALVDTDEKGESTTLNAVFNTRIAALRAKIEETCLFNLCSVRVHDDGSAAARPAAWRIEVGGIAVESGTVATPVAGEALMDVVEPAILRQLPLLIGHLEARQIADKLAAEFATEFAEERADKLRKVPAQALGSLALAARDIVAREGRLMLKEHGNRLAAAADNVAQAPAAFQATGIVAPEVTRIVITKGEPELTFEDLQESVHAESGVVVPRIDFVADPALAYGQWHLTTEPPLLTLSSGPRLLGIEEALAGAADRLLGAVALRWQLQQVRESEPDLVDAVRAAMDEATLLERLRGLLREGHSILPLRQALEHLLLNSPLPAATREATAP